MSEKKKSTPEKSKKKGKSSASKASIEQAYWEHILENGKKPASVYSLCKEVGITEKEFYASYSSFQALVMGFWERTVTETQEILDQDEDYQGYDARGKLLAFFYTYFERALEHRSRYLVAFPRKHRALCCPSLQKMKAAFESSAKDLMAVVVSEGTSSIPSKITEESYRGGWPVFLFLIDFWLDDTSDAFQDTDSLIEKAVRFGHEVTHFSAIDAALDLGKFLFGRKMA